MMMGGQPRLKTVRISAGLTLPVLSQLRAGGIEVDPILGQLGLCEERLRLAEARIPHDLWVDLLEAGRAATADPHFALHAAEQMGPGLHPLLGHLASSQRTASEAYSVSARYLHVLHEGISMELEEVDGEVSCRLIAERGLRFPPIAMEFLLARWVCYGREVMAGTEIELTEVRFAHPRGASRDEYERLFQSRVVFDARFNELIFPAWNLELPTAKADPVLQAALTENVKQLLAQLSDQPSLTTQIREHLMTQLQRGNPGIDAVATQFHMSERTLRRRLQEEGATFKQIVDDLRRELAIKYVQEKRLSTGEISFLLGFSEPSAFQRAFKRWTKFTPAEYRGR